MPLCEHCDQHEADGECTACHRPQCLSCRPWRCGWMDWAATPHAIFRFTETEQQQHKRADSALDALRRAMVKEKP